MAEVPGRCKGDNMYRNTCCYSVRTDLQPDSGSPFSSLHIGVLSLFLTCEDLNKIHRKCLKQCLVAGDSTHRNISLYIKLPCLVTSEARNEKRVYNYY